MKKLIIAHRGANKLAHENTLEAFQKAIDVGADMIELDVRKLGDGTLVVYHYELLRGRLIRRLNYSQVLKLSNKSGFCVPTLKQALELIAGKTQLNIELKEKGYEREVLDLALKYFSPEQFVVSSFRGCVVLFCRQKYPQIKAGLIVDIFFSTVYDAVRYVDFSYFVDSLKRREEAVMASDFLVLPKILYNRGFMDRENFNKKTCLIYSVDEDKQIKKYLSRPNVLGIISNRPELALKVASEFNF